MTSRSLTPEQSKALTTREVSIALSAGAGCGKTFVLTERFLDNFDPHRKGAMRPDQVSQMVAITFTEAAAREMRERIRDRCHQKLADTDELDAKAIEYWTQLLRSLDAARISTIHSFCGSLIRSHAVEAGIDPQFAVLEQGEADTLLAEIIDDTVRQLLADRDESIVDLLVQYSLDDVRDMAAKLATSRERVEYADWFHRTPRELAERWQQIHAMQAVGALVAQLLSLPWTHRLRQLAGEDLSPDPKLAERCAIIRGTFDRWQTDCDAQTVSAALEELHDAARIVGISKWRDNDRKEAFKKAAESVRAAIKKAQKQLVFDADAALSSAETALKVLNVANHVLVRYEASKRELARLDFDDLLLGAFRLLTDPRHEEVRRRMASQIRLLLVDEFQDTDPLQVELVKALCGEQITGGKLFLVGDLKQSIYRFRGAKPAVFVELQAELPEQGRLPLSTNFRSQPAILNFVNALFHNELTENYQPLVPHRQQVAAEPAVEFMWIQQQEEQGESETGVAARRREEARWIARRLRQIFDGGERLIWESDNSSRAARPGDAAILFRALSDVQFYEQALQEYDIPYYLVGGNAFYAQQEIFDVVNLLRTLASPADAIALAGVLRSPMFSLADETLYWLSQHDEGITSGLFAPRLHDAIKGDDRKRAEYARETLLALRSIKNRRPVADLLQQAIAMTAYDAVLPAEFLGERKLANLNKLVDIARTFDASGLFSLDDFISRLSTFVVDQPREPFAAMHPEAGNVVRLMTIHRSKGLEFPIVVVPDLERASGGHRERVAFSSELGPLVGAPAGATSGDAMSSGLELYNLLAAHEEEQENRRLLYVAATRTADFLLLSSSVKDIALPGSSWMNLLARHFNLSTGELTGTLPDGLAIPKVHVRLQLPDTSFKPIDGKTRPDLAKLVAAAELMAAEGKGATPPHVGPIPEDSNARRQFSFSRLTGELKRDQPEQAAVGESEFVLSAPILDALGLGTLVHAVLAELDTAALANPETIDVVRLVARHADRHIDDARGEPEQAIEMIQRFVQSPLAKRLGQAKESHMELEFLLGWPLESVSTEGPYLRGFIDRVWQDDSGDWHLLDFKTNFVTPESLNSTVGKYEMQMLLYALAVERILGKPPKSLTLHFLRTGIEHSLDWNAAARQRVIALVENAIVAARSGS